MDLAEERVWIIYDDLTCVIREIGQIRIRVKERAGDVYVPDINPKPKKEDPVVETRKHDRLPAWEDLDLSFQAEKEGFM
jgi:hypothetical protein